MAYNKEELQAISEKVQGLKYEGDLEEIVAKLNEPKSQDPPVYVNKLVNKSSVMLALLPVALKVGASPELTAKWGFVMNIAVGLPDQIDISGEKVQAVLMEAVNDKLIEGETIKAFIESAKEEVKVSDMERLGLKDLTLQDFKEALFGSSE